MFDINNNEIFLTQGNSAIIKITLINLDEGSPVLLQDGDKVLFTIKTHDGFTKLQKIMTKTDSDESGVITLLIEPSETIDWNIGTYWYDCLFITAEGVSTTFIFSTFTISKALGKYTDVE